MGNSFVSKCRKILQNVLDKLHKAFKWFTNYISSKIKPIVENFLKENQKKIEEAEDKEKTLQVLALKKCLIEGKKEMKKLEQELSEKDNSLINDLLNDGLDIDDL
jgi:hypothetical protein